MQRSEGQRNQGDWIAGLHGRYEGKKKGSIVCVLFVVPTMRVSDDFIRSESDGISLSLYPVTTCALKPEGIGAAPITNSRAS
jgi:hypothetical protein